ncbi:HlyD family secretion protein [Aquimarina sp. ERC-38]|uniref:HlyD family secretion protein n=1 Tax=Aquimarina sp. ERC-38 TaxID=2949996 RepID=UPI002245C5A5|nr:HlyD family efflux transporter periplasmic adaptor subunit [Aquimarina sp. ERC-38]UZO82456.1 HlyD family secretion protein [Aquimarina sp. ERC-38]
MLNISTNNVTNITDISEYSAVQRVFHKDHFKYFNRFLIVFVIVLIIILFLPWTQNVQAKGYVTTLTPGQRPQTLQSPIPGRIEEWFVQEGDFVKQGDTILRISEVKNEYFDPDLVQRTGQQLKSKELSVFSYSEKVNALENQISALRREQKLKLEQAQNKLMQSKLKVISDSIDLEAAKTNLTIAERQFERTSQLQGEGLKAVTDVEQKRLKLQETQAKLVAQQNKLLASRNNVLNAEIDINRLQAEYAEKISKAQSDKFTAQSNGYDSQAQVSKLESEVTNYKIRNGLYFVQAPQDGMINKAIQSGIGETFKEGDPLVRVMPTNYQLAVEMFVDPIDLPLMHIGEDVRIQFDGWPAIVFSGWPNASYGTYGGEIVAIETFISDNGKYRILVSPDETDHEWPEGIRVGSGAQTMALLDDVPIWYEAWRRLNGFPANYYQPDVADVKTEKKKKK